MFKKMLLTVCVIISNPTSFLCAETEVRRITPPKLSTNCLGQKVLCHRPMRKGSPKVSVEQRYGKIIVNNYGHGGGGWTLAPGSADYANNLLLNSDANYCFGSWCHRFVCCL
jgi:glycine/D-amino acid oxidase-like deaminating enzyme